MSDEEDDYMSDKFLNGLQEVRPSLVHSRAKKRKNEVDEKQKEHIRRQRESKKLSSPEVANNTLQNALSKPLTEENKGFKLLAKIGYKPGQALGKSIAGEGSQSDAVENRLIEPIGITLKTDRQGFGREVALKELNEKRQAFREQRLKKQLGGVVDIEEFRRRTSQKYEENAVLHALQRCQSTCQYLDMDARVKNPEMLWFWPVRKDEEISDDDDIEEVEEDEHNFSNSEKLELLTHYLRTSYLFCYWCGIHFKNEDDLRRICPGLTEDDH